MIAEKSAPMLLQLVFREAAEAVERGASERLQANFQQTVQQAVTDISEEWGLETLLRGNSRDEE